MGKSQEQENADHGKPPGVTWFTNEEARQDWAVLGSWKLTVTPPGAGTEWKWRAEFPDWENDGKKFQGIALEDSAPTMEQARQVAELRTKTTLIS